MAHPLDEPIRLAAYDPAWPDHAAAEIRRLQESLLATVHAIEHIGSTAVPRMTAKPIVDLMIGIATVPPPSSLLRKLEALGYESLGEAGVSGRWYLRRRAPSAFNLAIFAHDGPLWRQNLAVREFLRRSPEAAEDYADYKQALWNRGARSLLDYSEQKAAWMAELFACAQSPRNADSRETRPTRVDRVLIAEFEACTISPDRFHHAEHLRLVWSYLQERPLPEVLARMRDGLKKYATSLGKSERYHETVTFAFTLLVHDRIHRAEAPADLDWNRFAERNPDLLNGKILERYYLPETLASERAKRVYVLPDHRFAAEEK